MSDLFERLWAWILSLFGGEPKAIKIKGKTLCVPLFYPRQGGGVDGTWNYLSKSPAPQKYCREQVKAVAVRGEQPAITFLLAPSNEAGNIWAPFPNVDAGALAIAKARSSASRGAATLFADEALLNSLPWLVRKDLVIGFLIVSGGPVVLRHPEHDAIRLPTCTFYVGRQIESAGAAERVVSD